MDIIIKGTLEEINNQQTDGQGFGTVESNNSKSVMGSEWSSSVDSHEAVVHADATVFKTDALHDLNINNTQHADDAMFVAFPSTSDVEPPVLRNNEVESDGANVSASDSIHTQHLSSESCISTGLDVDCVNLVYGNETAVGGTLTTSAAVSDITILSFTDVERTIINNYISLVTPHSMIASAVVITEDPIEKAEIFVTCYRILMNARNVISEKETRDKIDSLLASVRAVHNDVFKLIVSKKNTSAMTQLRIKRQLKNIFVEHQNMQCVNNIIDIFVNMAERYELLDINKLTGINLDEEEGKKFEKELLSGASDIAPQESF